MVRESLARGFKPAGFEQPEDKRDYVKPRRELQKAFYQWVDELPDYLDWEVEYNKVCELISPLGEVSYKEANSLLAGFRPKTKGQEDAGLFISACYTHSPENVIIFDIDAPEISCIGYKTNKNIFNNGKVGNYFAGWSSGPVMNNGECGYRFAEWSSGLVVAVKEPKDYGWKKEGRPIKPADCDRSPELKKYIDSIAEKTKKLKDATPEEVQEILKDLDAQTIEKEINRLIGT